MFDEDPTPGGTPMAGDEAPINRYSLVDPLTGEVERSPSDEERRKGDADRGGAVVRWLTAGLLGICLAIWAVLGVLFWLPFVIRAVVQFSVAHIRAMLAGRTPHAAGRVLRQAVDFYRQGFLVGIEAVMSEDAPEPSGPGMGMGRLLAEVVWAVLVWYVVLLLVGVVSVSPAELWQSVVGYSWSDVVEWVRSLFGGLTGAAPGAPPDSVTSG